ncbi:MAG: outer membrane beta-barrel protein [Aquabacterium sp.]
MKKIVLFASLVAACSWASAQGYVGAVAALTRLSDACTDTYRCSGTQAKGFKVFAGTYLPKGQGLDLVIGQVNRVEVGAMRFGRVNSRSTTTVPDLDEDFNPINREVDVTDKVKAEALTVAAVAEFPVLDQFSLVAKLGVAYVTSTVKFTRDNQGIGAKSQNSIRPYAGLGVEVGLPAGIRVMGTADWTRYAVDGRSGSATQLGLGASVSF